MKAFPRSIIHKFAAASAILLLASGCGSNQKSDARPDVLKFADTGIEGMEEMHRAFGEFVGVMEEISGMKVEFYPVADRTIAAAALAAGDVDIVLAGSTEYLFIKSRNDVRPIAAIERAEYYSVVIVPVDSPAQKLEDLRGKKIGFKEPGSTSGHVVPSRMFLDAGMQEGVDYEGPMVDRLRFEMLYAGDLDAIAGGIRDFRKTEEDHPGKYRVLAQSDTLPRDLFVARGGLDPELVDALEKAILDNGERIMEAILGPGARDKYMGAKIVPANDADYDSMRETHKILNLPYDQ